MSGVNFNSPVSNQKASPAIYASSLATRPAPLLPGRIFVDTDNPSTGMYRDTGTAWVQIAGTGGGGSQDLQSVTDIGYTTTNPMQFLYPSTLSGTEIDFYNQDTESISFKIDKRAQGISTNESLIIEATKESGAAAKFGLLFDPSQTVLHSFYDVNYQELGLKLDFSNNSYWIGDLNNVSNGGALVVNNAAPEIVTNWVFGYAGLYVSESKSEIGDFSGVFESTKFRVEYQNNLIASSYQGSNIGIKLDFNNNLFSIGDIEGNLPYQSYVVLEDYDTNSRSFRMFNSGLNDSGESFYQTIFSNWDEGMGMNYQNNVNSDYSNFVISTSQIAMTSSSASNGNFGRLLLNFISAQLEAYYGNTGNNSSIVAESSSSIRKIRLQFTGNSSFFEIDDFNQKINVSNNFKSATAGGSSGQHLKINVGGTDYKIALLNP